MKKITKFVTILIIIIVLYCGCGMEKQDENKRNRQKSKKESEYIITNDESGMSFAVNKIPYGNIKYNNEKIGLKSIDFYDAGGKGEGYTLYSVLVLDFSNASEESVYKMTKEIDGELSGIDIYSGIICKNHDLHNEDSEEEIAVDMEMLNYKYSSKEATFLLHLPYYNKECDFSDAYVYIDLNMKQDETYMLEDTTLEMNTRYSYSWYFSGNENKEETDKRVFELKLNHHIPEDVMEMIIDGLSESEEE